MFSDLIPTVDIACVLLCTTLTLNPKESQRIFDFDQQISTKQKGKKKKKKTVTATQKLTKEKIITNNLEQPQRIQENLKHDSRNPTSMSKIKYLKKN